MEKYYNIKYKNNPEAYGIAVRVKDNKLEIFAGVKQDIIEFEVSLDDKGNLKVGKNYFFNLINKNKANKLKAIEKEWKMTQLYFAEEGSSHLSFGLGGRVY